MEGIVSAMEETPSRKIIMTIWKDYIIGDGVIFVVKSATAIMKQWIPAGGNSVQMLCMTSQDSCWRKLHPDVVHDFTRLMTEPIKEIMKEIVDMEKLKKKKLGWRVPRYGSWRNSSVNRHHTRGMNRRWLDGDECQMMKKKTEKTVPENKLASDNLVEE